MSNQPVLQFKNVSKKFEKKTVLKDVSFEVYPGESFGVIGMSGGGKTTLFRLILGYYKPTSGAIFFQGKSIKDNLMELRKSVGYSTQETSFYGKLTLYENMMYFARLYKVKPRDKSVQQHILDILTQVKLIKHKDVLATKVSGGMKHRLNFALSILHDPAILVMDEPTTGLDPLLVDEFWELIDVFKKQGKTIIITSHIFEEIERNCDRVIVLHGGEVKGSVNVPSLQGHMYDYFKNITRES